MEPFRFAVAVASLAFAGAVSSLAFAAAGYRGVPSPSSARRGAKLSTVCAACHGPRGNSISPTFPNLAGQNYNYLLKELQDFRSGLRRATPMNTLMKAVPESPSDRNLKDLSAYFAAQKLDRTAGANATAQKPSEALATVGYRLYVGGEAAKGVPACAACHMVSGLGNAPMAIPALAGQQAEYVRTELRRFAQGKRHNSPEHVMAIIAKRLTDKQIRAVGAYVQALRPRLVPGIGPRSFAAYVKAVGTQPVPGITASGISSAASAASGGHGGS